MPRNALAKKLRGVGVELEGDEIALLDRLLVGIVEGRVVAVAAEQVAGALRDHLDRGGGQAELEAVEPAKEVTVDVVDRAVALVGDDQIEEAGIEAAEDLRHRRVRGKIDPVVALP